jgi:hypothetical protein
MKADEPKSAANPQNEVNVPPPATIPDPDLAVGEGIAEFWQRVKAILSRHRRGLGFALLLLLALGLWLFWSSQVRQSRSQLWAELERISDSKKLREFADQNPGSKVALIARLELARNQFGPNGVALLNVRDAEQRKKGIENIENARAEFLALAVEFADDLSLQAECLKAAAAAELALVGIPKPDKPGEYRGSITEAIALYEKLAGLVGVNTPVGQWADQRVSDLKARGNEAQSVGVILNNLMTPPPVTDIQPPTSVEPTANSPTTPVLPSTPATAPIPTPTPPTKAATVPSTPTTPATPPTKAATPGPSKP